MSLAQSLEEETHVPSSRSVPPLPPTPPPEDETPAPTLIVSAADFDSQDDRFRICDFLAASNAFDVMPDSSRIIVIEDSVSCLRAWRVLDEHSASAAIVWDAAESCYIGLFSSTDVMQMLLMAGAARAGQEFELLGQLSLRQWYSMREQPAADSPSSNGSSSGSLHFITPDTSLKTAIRHMLGLNIHRLPVINEWGSVTHLLTYRNICRFLVSNYRLSTAVLDVPASAVVLRRAGAIETLPPSASLREVMEVLLTYKLSAVPIVDTDGRCIDIFSKEDVVNLVRWRQTKITLDSAISILLENRPANTESMHTMPKGAKIGQVLKFIAEKRVHRVVLLEDDGHINDIISLRYILSFLSEH